MKYIQLTLEDDLHKEIKLKAIQSGKTIPKYILDCINGLPILDNEPLEMKKFVAKPSMYKDVMEQKETTTEKPHRGITRTSKTDELVILRNSPLIQRTRV